MKRPQALEALATALSRLPGIGPVSSERLAYHLMNVPLEEAKELANAILVAREDVRLCSRCGNLDQRDPCWICSDESRDRSVILVVEGARELLSFENAGYRGLYHVLHGRLAPLEGISEEDLAIAPLLQRLAKAEAEAAAVLEVCIGTNPDLEGESTSDLLGKRLSATNVKVTRIARGIPAGATISQVQNSILSDALEGRREL